ncbi:cytochrome P450 [Atractiella rhizophila]|nr:cytochrome P450 [Atractiella rhizophila]
MLDLSLTLVLALLFVVYLVFTHWNNALGTRRRPDLKTHGAYPLIGNTLEYLFSEDMLELAVVCLRECGGPGFSDTVIGQRFIDVSRPDWIEYVQKTNFENYVKGEFIGEIFRDAFGEGIFAVDGASWYSQRKIASHIFTISMFKGIISYSLDQSLSRLISFLDKQGANNSVVDLTDLFYRLMLDSFSFMAFSHDLGTLNDPLSKAPVEIADAFNFVQAQLIHRIVNPFWKLTERFGSRGRKFRRSLKIMDDFVGGIIEKRMEKPDVLPFEHKDLLAFFIEARHENGSALTKKELRDAVLNFLIAGRDTTAQVLAWAFFHLIRRPELVDELREELSNLGQEVDYDNHKILVKFHAVFFETLRLHPSVPASAKQCVKHDQIPDGPRIEPGDLVVICDWQMARDPEIWGDDCLEFKIDRWIDEKGDLKRVSPYKAHGFNAGPRLCLGHGLALFNGVKTLAALVEKYDFSFPSGWWERVEKTAVVDGHVLDEAPKYYPGLTLAMKEPLLATVGLRKQR